MSLTSSALAVLIQIHTASTTLRGRGQREGEGERVRGMDGGGEREREGEGWREGDTVIVDLDSSERHNHWYINHYTVLCIVPFSTHLLFLTLTCSTEDEAGVSPELLAMAPW